MDDATSAVSSRNREMEIVTDTTNDPRTNSLYQKSIANKMRGIGKKISRFRSRSAERVSQRSRNSPDRQEATDDNGLSKPDIVPLQYPSRRQDKWFYSDGIKKFRSL